MSGIGAALEAIAKERGWPVGSGKRELDDMKGFPPGRSADAVALRRMGVFRLPLITPNYGELSEKDGLKSMLSKMRCDAR